MCARKLHLPSTNFLAALLERIIAGRRIEGHRLVLAMRAVCKRFVSAPRDIHSGPLAQPVFHRFVPG